MWKMSTQHYFFNFAYDITYLLCLRVSTLWPTVICIVIDIPGGNDFEVSIFKNYFDCASKLTYLLFKQFKPIPSARKNGFNVDSSLEFRLKILHFF